jgi:Transmembrane domain of unknown function (DUF3566)
VTDHPQSLDPADGGSDPSDRGWGSPVPAEYGSLRALRSQAEEGSSGSARGQSRARPSGAGWRWQRQLRSRSHSEVREPVDDLDSGVVPPDPWTPNPALRAGALDGAVAAEALRSTAPIVEADDRHAVLPPQPEIADLAPAAPAFTAEQALAAASLAVTEGRDRRRRSRRGVERIRSRVTIRHVDVSTVARVSLVFYFLVAIAVVVASVLLWYAANAFGSLTSIEKSVRTLFDLRTFTLHVGRVAEYTAAGGLVLALVGTLFNVLAALTYNLICDIVGGFRIEVESVAAMPSEVRE